MHRADDKTVQVRHKWKVQAHGMQQGASGLQA